MIIGIDLDDTITNTKEKLYTYAHEFADKFNYDINDVLVNNNTHINVKYSTEFMINYYEEMFNSLSVKENASLVIKYLKDKGNKVYLITARPLVPGNDIVKDIRKYLLKNNIIVDGIYAGHRDKLAIINELKVDIMIDDNIILYNKLIEVGKGVILFDTEDKYDVNSKVTNWLEIKNFLEEGW